MKNSIRFINWFFIPAVLALSVVSGDPRLPLVAAVAMWGIGSTMGPLALATVLASLSLKPSSPNWVETVEKSRANNPGPVAKALGWFCLFLSTVLAAYLGYVVTAVFYLAGGVWVRCAWGLCRHHFENAQAAS